MGEREIEGQKGFPARVEDLFVRGDHEAILALAKERLAQHPDDLEARIAQCRVFVQQGKVDEARGMLLELEALLAGLSQLYTSLGDLCLKKGWEEEARSYYRKTMFLNPNAPAMPENGMPAGEGRTAAEVPQEETQPAAGQDAEGHHPDEEEGEVPADFQTVTLAELYIRQGHLAQAVEVLEAILRKDPWQTKAAEKLWEVRAQLGQGRETGDQREVITELSRWLERLERRR